MRHTTPPNPVSPDTLHNLADSLRHYGATSYVGIMAHDWRESLPPLQALPAQLAYTLSQSPPSNFIPANVYTLRVSDIIHYLHLARVRPANSVASYLDFASGIYHLLLMPRRDNITLRSGVIVTSQGIDFGVLSLFSSLRLLILK